MIAVSDPNARPKRLAFLVIPLAIAPLVLAWFPAEKLMFFIILGSIALAAPAAGFWLGELRGKSEPGRAALGCVGTVALFVFYMLWFLVLAPLLRGS
jgi:hypothetical protein